MTLVASQGHPHPPATLLFQCSSYPGVSQELESSWIWSEWTNTWKQPFSQTSGFDCRLCCQVSQKETRKIPTRCKGAKEDEIPFCKAKAKAPDSSTFIGYDPIGDLCPAPSCDTAAIRNEEVNSFPDHSADSITSLSQTMFLGH